MATLSGLFDLSQSALASDQAALSATANNVANQNTPGYTRQLVEFQSGDTVTLSNGQSIASSGPAATISSKRDRVLEQRVQQQTQAQAQTSARAGVLGQIENVFSITGSSATAGSTQIGSAIDTFFSSLSALGTNPADASTRLTVLSAARGVTSAFHAAATQLAQVDGSINADLTRSVTAINGLTATIAQLNAKIGENSPNADAGALEDQRQQAIGQLSEYLGLDQVATEGNGITLTTRGGTVLVAGAQAFQLSARITGGTTKIRTDAGADVSGSIEGGSVGGELAAQSTDLPAVTKALDALAYRIGSAVNAQNAAGVLTSGGGAGAAGGPVFGLTATSAGAAAGLSVVATDASAIASAAPGEGIGGNGNANALADLRKVTDTAGLTISGFLASTLGSIGTSSAQLQQQASAEQASLTQLTSQRDSLSRVSLDEEAAHLSEYQRSYEASAKLFSVLNTLLASAINLGEQTTVA